MLMTVLAVSIGVTIWSIILDKKLRKRERSNRECEENAITRYTTDSIYKLYGDSGGNSSGDIQGE